MTILDFQSGLLAKPSRTGYVVDKLNFSTKFSTNNGSNKFSNVRMGRRKPMMFEPLAFHEYYRFCFLLSLRLYVIDWGSLYTLKERRKTKTTIFMKS